MSRPKDGYITVLIADDHPIVRDGLAALLTGDEEIRVVGGCGDGPTTVAEVERLKPTVLVLDVGLPGMNGLDVCAELRRRRSNTVVLFLSMHADVRIAVQGLNRGGMGYIVKGAATKCLKDAILAVADGQRYISQDIAAAVEEELSHAAGDPYDQLTTRERQVIRLIGEGKSTAEIAQSLNTSVSTVHVHRFNLMRKLKIDSQAALAKYACSRAAIDPEVNITPRA